jgi:hypothetical protein
MERDTVLPKAGCAQRCKPMGGRRTPATGSPLKPFPDATLDAPTPREDPAFLTQTTQDGDQFPEKEGAEKGAHITPYHNRMGFENMAH